MGVGTKVSAGGNITGLPGDVMPPQFIEIANGESAVLYDRLDQGRNNPLLRMLVEVVSISAGDVNLLQCMEPGSGDGKTATGDYYNTAMNAARQQRVYDNLAPLGRVTAYADGGDAVLVVTMWFSGLAGRYDA